MGKTLSYNHLSFLRCSSTCLFFLFDILLHLSKVESRFHWIGYQTLFVFFVLYVARIKLQLPLVNTLGLPLLKPLSSQHEIWRFVNHTDPIALAILYCTKLLLMFFLDVSEFSEMCLDGSLLFLHLLSAKKASSGISCCHEFLPFSSQSARSSVVGGWYWYLGGPGPSSWDHVVKAHV